MLTTSLYMMQVFDRVLGSGSRETLLYLTVVACGAVLLLAVLDAVRSRTLVRVSGWIEQKLAPATFPRMVDGILERKGERGEALQDIRSEEHTSELQSLMRISYAVFCLTKKNNTYS